MWRWAIGSLAVIAGAVRAEDDDDLDAPDVPEVDHVVTLTDSTFGDFVNK
jgi:hypothetical protein